MTELVRFATPDAFLERISEACLGREAELNLMLGVAAGAEQAFACTLDEGDAITAAALRTPPHGFVLASWATGAAAAIARALREAGHEPDAPSVIGTAKDAEAFARAWTPEPKLEMAQRIYAVREVVAMNMPPKGELRVATQADLDTIAPWYVELMDEAENVTIDLETARSLVKRRIAKGTLFVWDVGAPVSLVGLARETFTGIAVNSVFTPPKLRRNGYATAAVEAISRRAIEGGRAFCCLYTDATNPTSNVIYQRVGYRFVCESALWSLG